MANIIITKLFHDFIRKIMKSDTLIMTIDLKRSGCFINNKKAPTPQLKSAKSMLQCAIRGSNPGHPD